jgi:hypothetical protein
MRCFTAKNGSGFFASTPVHVADRNAYLTDATQTFLDKPPVPSVTRLIAPREQRCRLLWIECWPQRQQCLLGPVLRGAFGGDAKVAPREE